MKALQKKSGFTLAELLIVIAIIGVLVAVAVPVFGAQRERANIAVDQATMRNAYAQFVSEQLTGSVESEREYFYDAAAQAFVPASGTGASRPTGYGKAKADASGWWSGVGTASGAPNNGTAAPLLLKMDADGAVTFLWASGTYIGANVKTVEEYKGLTPEEKVARDKLLLDSLQSVVRSMTYGDLYNMFYDSNTKNVKEEFQGSSVTSLKNNPNNTEPLVSSSGYLYITLAESTIVDGKPVYDVEGGERNNYSNSILAKDLFESAGYSVSDMYGENYLINSVEGSNHKGARIWLCFGVNEKYLKDPNNWDQPATKAYTYIKGAGADTPAAISNAGRKNG